MKITRDTIEQLAWWVVALVVVAAVAVGVMLYNLGHRIDARTKDIQGQMQCIGDYFNQTDRANLRINDLDQCNITKIQ